MGASQSVLSGHHAHPEGRHHRLKRVSINEAREPCMMCSKPVELGEGEVAYRCRHAGCGFVLHDACYHLPKKIKHFAHSSHQLTLSDGHQLPAGRRSCNICAVNFDTNTSGGGRPSSYIYGCKRCSGFYAAGRCRNAKRSEAWSYQCNQCDVDVCLECQLPDGRPPTMEPKNGCGNAVQTLGAVAQKVATATGTALRALCCAWLGPPMAAATPASN